MKENRCSVCGVQASKHKGEVKRKCAEARRKVPEPLIFDGKTFRELEDILKNHFQGTSFKFGYEIKEHSIIAYGIGWSSAFLKEVSVDFKTKIVILHNSPAWGAGDKLTDFGFITLEDLLKQLPKTENDFDRVLTQNRKGVG